MKWINLKSLACAFSKIFSTRIMESEGMSLKSELLVDIAELKFKCHKLVRLS